MVRSDHKVLQAQRALLVQPVPSDPLARTEWTERLDPKVQRDPQVLSVHRDLLAPLVQLAPRERMEPTAPPALKDLSVRKVRLDLWALLVPLAQMELTVP
jgi:hypothetical protein